MQFKLHFTLIKVANAVTFQNKRNSILFFALVLVLSFIN
ncbi:MAG: hypothetical protein ACI9XB_003133 [Gammaproteobacteria bacterium]|jgi:hypothetical protein